jgi:transcriptional regulator GlxA family with amidase domain/YHS domain-containing protein
MTTMNRRELFRLSSALGLTAALPAVARAAAPAPAAAPPLRPPAAGSIAVAVLLSRNAEVIDFAGPWEVFDNVGVPGRDKEAAFQLYTVAATTEPITATGGMVIVPNHTFATAPPPRVIVIPAQSRPDAATLEWVRAASQTADLTMSVCTGAFLLAATGLLDGGAATTHHGFFRQFAMQFPDIELKRGARYVEWGKFASAGGLSSGIDLALRVVERYFGRAVAANVANGMEYQGLGWLDPQSNRAYAQRPVSTDSHPLCPVCDMGVDKGTALSSVYRKRTFYFCMEAHKKAFDARPAGFLAA